jgi:hypothetical protein
MRLYYRLESASPWDTFDSGASWQGRLGAFEGELQAGRLSLTTGEAVTPLDARASVEPLLRDWESSAWLDGGYEFRFIFDGVASSDARMDGSGQEGVVAEPSPLPPPDAILRRINLEYPFYDSSFRRSPLLESMLTQIQHFHAQEAPLTETLQNVLRILRERFAPGDAGTTSELAGEHVSVISRALNTDREVISTAAELAWRTAPAAKVDQRVPFRGPEWQWMQQVLRRLALQAGRAHEAQPPERLTMGDLVTLR